MPLPEGTIPVGIGLLIAGLSSFAFLRVGKSALGGDEAFSPVLALWFATFALAPGFFLPLEQELGRAISHRRAIGQGARPVVRKVVVLGAGLAALVVAVILAAGPAITNSYFDGDWVLVVALVISIASYAPTHISRGVCSGSGRFRSYAVVMGSDGVVRIKAQRFRTLERNRQDACARLAALVAEASKVVVARVATRPTRASQRRRVDAKVVRGRVKADRRRVRDAGVPEAELSIDDRGVRKNPIFQRATALINARPARSPSSRSCTS